MAMMALTMVATAGCVMSDREPGRVDSASPAALAALPRGVDPGFLIQDENGCYGVALVAGEVPTGVPLRDATGTQICDV